MVNYNTGNINQKNKLYEMLLNSLNYVDNSVDKKNVCEEMNKLENEIIDLTNEVYEEAFCELDSKSTCLLEEEKARLIDLINMVNDRVKYLEERRKKHYTITKLNSKDYFVKGENNIEDYTKKINIIDKYQENVNEISKLEEEINSINEKIKLAQEKNKINENLNLELENKMISLLDEVYKELNLNEIKENKEEIESTFKDLDYSLNLARENLSLAKNNSNELFLECKDIYDNTLNDYNKFLEYKQIIELADIYSKKTETFEDLLIKREKIENIFSKIPNSELYKKVYSEINEQYLTILIEKQDILTMNSLMTEKSSKEKVKVELEDENNSKEFQGLLQELLINEQKRQKQELLEKQRQEEKERQLKLLEEKEKQEEIYKRQQLIEEKRKKETAERTKWLIEANNKTVIKNNNDEFLNTLNNLKVPDIEEKEEELDNDSFIEAIKNVEAEIKEDEFFEEPVVEPKKSSAEDFFTQDFDEYQKNFKVEDYDDDSLFVEDVVFPDISI